MSAQVYRIKSITNSSDNEITFNDDLTKLSTKEIDVLLEIISECYDSEYTEITSYDITQNDDNTCTLFYDAMLIHYGEYELDRCDQIGPMDNWYASSIQWIDFDSSGAFDIALFEQKVDKRFSLSVNKDEIILYTPEPEDGEIVVVD